MVWNNNNHKIFLTLHRLFFVESTYELFVVVSYGTFWVCYGVMLRCVTQSNQILETTFATSTGVLVQK